MYTNNTHDNFAKLSTLIYIHKDTTGCEAVRGYIAQNPECNYVELCSLELQLQLPPKIFNAVVDLVNDGKLPLNFKQIATYELAQKFAREIKINNANVRKITPISSVPLRTDRFFAPTHTVHKQMRFLKFNTKFMCRFKHLLSGPPFRFACIKFNDDIDRTILQTSKTQELKLIRHIIVTNNSSFARSQDRGRALREFLSAYPMITSACFKDCAINTTSPFPHLRKIRVKGALRARQDVLDLVNMLRAYVRAHRPNACLRRLVLECEIGPEISPRQQHLQYYYRVQGLRYAAFEHCIDFFRKNADVMLELGQLTDFLAQKCSIDVQIGDEFPKRICWERCELYCKLFDQEAPRESIRGLLRRIAKSPTSVEIADIKTLAEEYEAFGPDFPPAPPNCSVQVLYVFPQPEGNKRCSNFLQRLCECIPVAEIFTDLHEWCILAFPSIKAKCITLQQDMSCYDVDAACGFIETLQAKNEYTTLIKMTVQAYDIEARLESHFKIVHALLHAFANISQIQFLIHKTAENDIYENINVIRAFSSTVGHSSRGAVVVLIND